MIGQLKGTLIEKHPPMLLIDVNGVGYEVKASMNTFYALPEVGEQTTLYTHFVVREDAQELYAFHNKEERELFRTAIKVSGVGPKMALAILSTMDPTAFVVCINNNDVTSLVRIPGVGKKTAERLIVEMKDRLKDWSIAGVEIPAATGGTSMTEANDVLQDAISALIALGYKPQDASRVISKLYTPELTSEALIRLALQNI